MLKKKITFLNMEHSMPLEEHANQKLDKILDILRGNEAPPFYAEMWIKANKLHPHHTTDLHLKTARFTLHAHEEGTDMYVVVDNTIDKMITLIRKEKEKNRDLAKHTDTDKSKFGR